MSDNVIILVSSSEDEDGDDSKKPNSKTAAVKKKKIKPNDVLTKIPTHKTAPNILKQVHPKQIFVQNFNNQKQKVTVIHGFKNKLTINPLAAKDSNKFGNVPSAVTLKPLSANTIIAGTGTGTGTGTGIGKTNQVKLITPKPTMTPVTATPKTNAVSLMPKIIGSVSISPKIVNATLASPTASLTSKSKDNAKDSSVQRPIKRIHPVKISDSVTMRASSIEKSSDSDMMSHDSVSTANDETVASPNQANTKTPTKRPQAQDGTVKSVPPKRVAKSQNQSVPLNADCQNLIDACKAADSSADMVKIVEKLQRYYRRAPSEYVNSSAFRNLVNDVTHIVKTNPSIMFHKLIDLMAELKTRKSEMNGAGDGDGDDVVEIVEVVPPPVDPKEREKEEKRAKKIKRMSNVLQKLQVRIRKYEQAEVDWDDEGNSHYMITERLKQRAYKIYVKLCEHTGESRNTEQSVRKTIKFDATKYREFNKKLQIFVNESGKFPDMFDVMRIIEHCNEKYGYRLNKEHQRAIAQVAFVKVGEWLQERRKLDFYEMMQYHASSKSDPAREDESLMMKLEENRKYYNKRMDDVIDKYTMCQRSSDDEDEQRTSGNVDRNPSTSNGKTKSKSSKNKPATASVSVPVPSSRKSPVPQSKAKATSKPTPTPTTAPPQPKLPPPPQPTKMDIALDITDEDDLQAPNEDLLIIPDDVLTIMDDEDMQEIQNDLFPTITSVTSLHPGNSEQFSELLASPLENGGIL